MSIVGWLNDQQLRMIWLNDLVGAVVAAIGLDPASRLGGEVQFFVFDVIKILILLSALTFALCYVQSHFPAGTDAGHAEWPFRFGYLHPCRSVWQADALSGQSRRSTWFSASPPPACRWR